MGHAVLLGDSVSDDGAHVAPGEHDVVRQLHECLPGGWRATLAAAGRAVIGDVPRQLARLPPDATRLEVSAGGNDALFLQGALGEPAGLVAETPLRLAELRDGFARACRTLLGAQRGCGLPVAVRMTYDPRFPDPALRRVAVAALALVDDVIAREAFGRGLPLVELRQV